MNDRPSWGYCPDDLRWSNRDTQDRVRIVLIALAIIGICLFGAIEP